jgi:hypothetical protein
MGGRENTIFFEKTGRGSKIIALSDFQTEAAERPRWRHFSMGSRRWSAQAQPRSFGPSLCEVWGLFRLSGSMTHLSSHPSPSIRVCTPVCAEAVRSCDLCSGFEPAKALLLSPVRGLPFATGGSRERRDPGWDGMLGGKNTIGRVGCYFQPRGLLCCPGFPNVHVQMASPFGCQCRSRTVSRGVPALGPPNSI